mgnify:CR=1 FL=1
MSKSKTILGLDLGTWTCQACVVVDGKPALIQPDRHYPQASPTSLAYEAKYMTSAYCHRPPEAGGPVVGPPCRTTEAQLFGGIRMPPSMRMSCALM